MRSIGRIGGILLALAILSLGQTASGGTFNTVAWSWSDVNQYKPKLATAPDGGVIVGTRFQDVGGARLAKYSSSGALQWTTNTPASERVQANGLGTDALGNCYVAGYTDANLYGQVGDSDIFVQKFSPDGNFLWGRQYGSTIKDYASGMAVQPDGRCYVVSGCGATNYGVPPYPSYTNIRQYDANGSVNWVTNLTVPDQYTYPGGSSSDHRLAIRGSYGYGYFYNYLDGGHQTFHYLSRFNPDTGNVLWTIPFTENVAISQIAIDSAGNLYAAQGGSTIYNYSPAGALLWTKSTSWSGSEVITITDDDRIFVGGYDSHDGFSNRTARVGEINSSGTFLWNALLPSIDGLTPRDCQDLVYSDVSGGLTVSCNFLQSGNQYGTAVYSLTPEPLTLSLLVIGGIAILNRRRSQVRVCR